jgi:hypothetical protein
MPNWNELVGVFIPFRNKLLFFYPFFTLNRAFAGINGSFMGYSCQKCKQIASKLFD